MRRLFSFSETETENFNVKKEKIEVVSCPRKEMVCKEHLSVVNKCYNESELYRRERDFQRSIDILKSAFYKTTELKELPCSKCAVLFRSTITESLKNIHDELGKMTTGIFGNNRYQYSFNMAVEVLKELEKVGISNAFQFKESNERFLGNYLNKKVS
jgi:hypothetical protein